MPPRPPVARTNQSKPRAIRFVLRDGDVLDGSVYLTEGHALSPYLSSRKGGWMNVVSAAWRSEGIAHPHVVVQSDDILFAASVDPDVGLSVSASTASRDVDVLLEDGSRLQGKLQLAARQRLSDYLASCGHFIPLVGAVHLPVGVGYGDVALNSTAVKAVRDAKSMSANAPSSAQAQAAWGGIRRGTPSQNDSLDTEEIVEGPSVNLDDAPLSPVEVARAKRMESHWLVRLALANQLGAPDPRMLSDRPSLDDIWAAISQTNNVEPEELATMVATAHKMKLADLDAVSPDALALVPARIAKRLGFLPVAVDKASLTIALSDPASMEIDQQLRFVTRLALKFEIAAPADIRGALSWYYGADDLPAAASG